MEVFILKLKIFTKQPKIKHFIKNLIESQNIKA